MSTDETRRLLALLDTGEPAAILDNAEAIADELRWLASKWEAVDRENTALGTAYADVREAADTLRRALSETMVRTVHYDWNADPDSITRLQGDAVALLERCTRSRDVLTSQQREAVLITERNQLRRYRDGWKRLAKMYRAQARHRTMMWERACDRIARANRQAYTALRRPVQGRLV